MIVGTGVDIIEIDRIRKAHSRWGDEFLRKVYVPTEIEYCLRKHDPAASLAARFAAKEAGFKAFSQAGVHIVKWRNLWVENDRSGRPKLNVNTTRRLHVHLSLSHSRKYAAATVVVESPEEESQYSGR
jgi:holo-[acyl-carrier protein] synthase